MANLIEQRAKKVNLPEKKKYDFVDLQAMLGGKPSTSDSDLPLCHYCGSCIAVCPHDALDTGPNEVPVFDEDKCTPCNLCLDFCSGVKEDHPQMAEFTFSPSSEKAPNVKFDDKVMGPYIQNYIAHATNDFTREKGSSGGMVSAMLSYALDVGEIQGAIVVGQNNEKPWLPQTKLVRTSKELRETAQSKYCYIPTNAFLKELWKEADGKTGKFAVVALPCQIQSIREMQRKNIKIAKNIKYTFSLICGYNMHYEATDFVRKKLGIKYDEIEQLKYRDQDWPGGMTFYLKDGTKKGIDIFHYHYLNAVFLPYRCRTACADYWGDFADICFGDSWLKELYKPGEKHLGYSSIVAKTGAGNELLLNAQKAGYVNLKPVEPEKIKESFPFNIKYKKRGINTRYKMSRHKAELVGALPDTSDMKFREQLFHIIYNCLLIVGASKPFKWVIFRLPFSLLRLAIQTLKVIMGYPPNARDEVINAKKG